jgi:hypothetical protein
VQEKHFQNEHHPCPHAECLAQKFVVFPSALDLKAHVVEKHSETMSARDLKDLRRVQAEFAPSDPGRGNRHTARANDRQNTTPSSTSNENTRHAESSAQGRRRQGFSSGLTPDIPVPTPPVPIERPIPDTEQHDPIQLQ